MGYELTGKKVSLSYNGLVQRVDGSYYNGDGQLLSITDASSLNNTLVEYVSNASLNSGQFFWNNGILDVSVIGGDGVSLEYVDGSLYIRDASINDLFTRNITFDTSIGTKTSFEYVDGSLSFKSDLAYVDGSLISIRATYIPDASLNSGQFFWNNGVLDVSVIGAGGVAQSYVDASLSTRDASIDFLLANQIIDESAIATIKATYIPDASLNHSQFIWNNGVLDASVIGGSGVSQAYVDGSLALRDVSISFLLVNQTADESSLSVLTSRHNFTETSLGVLTSRHSFTETSLGTLTIRFNPTETSLGTLTSRHNFTETSLGTLTSRHNFTETSLGLLTSRFESSIGSLETDKVNGTGLANQIAIWSGTKTLSGDTALVYDSVGNHLVIGTVATDASATMLVDAGVTNHNTIGRFKGNLDGFVQTEVKNYSAGPIASADVVATANTGTDETDYIDMGINNANYNAGDSKSLDGYLILKSDPSSADGANLLIGNATSAKDVILFTGDSIDAYANEKLRITGDGSILIGKPASKKYLLEVNGDINIPTGSHYLRNGQSLDDAYTTYQYTDGSLSVRDSSIIFLFNDKLSKTQFDSSLSKYVPYSGATQDLSLGSKSIRSVESIVFNSNPNVNRQEGQMFYDVSNKTLALHTANDVTLQIGQENLIIARNYTGNTIKNGKAVYMSDSSFGLPCINLAKADNILTASVIGITTQDILSGDTGMVTTSGIVHDMNTGNYLPGTILYLSDVSAGELISAQVLSPNVWTKVCRVIQSSHTTGSVFVNVQQERSINTLYDVGIINPQVDEVLVWNGVKWINSTGAAVSAGVGVTYFLADIPSDIPTYESMWKNPIDASESLEFKVVNSSTHLIMDTYASEPSSGLDVHLIDGGIWEFNTYAYVGDSLLAYSQIKTHVNKRSYLGVETSLFSVTTGDINSETPVLYSTAVVQPSFVVDPSDRLIFIYEAWTDSSTDVSINFYHGGSNYYTHVHTPLATRHNDLAGLQGGLSDQFYHLNRAQLTVVENTSGVNTGNQNLDPYALITNVNSSLNSIYVYTEKYLKESSLGSGFTWNNGYLDASGGGTGTGDVTKAYVDGSLSAINASLNSTYSLTSYVNSSTYYDAYNSAQDASISLKTSKLYVDGSLNRRDLSINDLYDNLASTVSISYIDGSLASRDACLGNIRATYIPDVSLNEGFVWTNGLLGTNTDPTVDYNKYKPFTGNVSLGYTNNFVTNVTSETSLGIKTVNITYNSNNDVSIININNYGTVSRQITFRRDVYRNITQLIIT